MKSNEQFARKCISHLPRLQNRNFRLVFNIKRAIAVLDIKPVSEAQLKAYFDNIQQFLIDHDLIANPTMGEDGDLFISFGRFQFDVGAYAGADVGAVLNSMQREFSVHSVVYNPFHADVKVSDPPRELSDEIIDRKFAAMHRAIRLTGGAVFAVRQVIPGPKGFNRHNTFHTTPWTVFVEFGRDLGKLTEPNLVITSTEGQSYTTTRDRQDVTFGISIPLFLAYLERKGLTFSEVSIDGTFTVRKLKV